MGPEWRSTTKTQRHYWTDRTDNSAVRTGAETYHRACPEPSRRDTKTLPKLTGRRQKRGRGQSGEQGPESEAGEVRRQKSEE